MVDTATRAKAHKEKAHRELLALYAVWDQTRHCDRDVFYATTADHLDAQPVWALKNWLRVFQPLIKHSIKEASRLAIHNMRKIHTYFHPADVPD